ncbi:MAG: hypothetical protein ACT4PK_04205 [Gammaproteobacteria bacterium]
MNRIASSVGLGLLATLATAAAQDLNIPRPVDGLERELQTAPMKIVTAAISRPKAKGDITLKAELSFGGQPPYRVKLRRAEPGAEKFNNRPRYDLAAYELQKLFLDPDEYVVPPTALRTVPVSELRPYAPAAQPTFEGSDEVFVVLQYWLHEVKVIEDVYDAERFDADFPYARNIGQLNVFTLLIAHGDSNVGNFLISRATSGARVFSIDNGISFAFNESDRGELWKPIRVTRIPSETVMRLRRITKDELERRLGIVGTWRRENGHWVAVSSSDNLNPSRGVRYDGDLVQMGLTRSEIGDVWRRLTRLLDDVDAGRIGITIGLPRK